MDDSPAVRPWDLYKSWMSVSQSNSWQEKLCDNLNWQLPLVRLYGKKHIVPRMTAFIARPGISYKYSGIVHSSDTWPEWVTPLFDLVGNFCEVNFNGCLVNLYRDGLDRMGWHSDNESELDASKVIASLSFGSNRYLYLKHKNLSIKEKIYLEHGDLFVMKPSCQMDWSHSVPIMRNVVDSRLNITFRRYIT